MLSNQALEKRSYHFVNKISPDISTNHLHYYTFIAAFLSLDEFLQVDHLIELNCLFEIFNGQSVALLEKFFSCLVKFFF